MCFNANFFHAQPQSLRRTYPGLLERSSKHPRTRAPRAVKLVFNVRSASTPATLLSPSLAADVRDTRRCHATLPLTDTLGRLARVRVGLLGFENNERSSKPTTSAQTARKIEPHDDSKISLRNHDFSIICVFRLRCCCLACAVPAAGARPPRRAALALLPLVPRTRTRQPLELAPRAAPRSRSCR